MNAEGDPTVVRHRVESKITVRLVGEPDLGFQVTGEEAKTREARAIFIKEEGAGELPLRGYALEERAEIAPVGQEKGGNVEQDLAVVPHSCDREGLGDGVAEGVRNCP